MDKIEETKRCICDLHTHSTFSDGKLTPTQIVEEARDMGLGAVALTDHNTSLGLTEFMEAGKRLGVHTIAGTEISTTYNRHEVHLVALFVPEERYDDITEYTRDLWAAKDASNRALAKALTEAGYTVDYDAMLAAAPGGQINRSGFGDELARRGYMSKDEAFATVLKRRAKGGKGLYDPPKRPGTLETVEFVRSIGALPVLAHPFLNFREPGELERFLGEAVPKGLGAMEVYYSTFSPQEEQRAAELVEEYGILASGGSDFHGAAKPDIALGTGRGSLSVPCSVAERLEEKAASLVEQNL